MDKVIIEKLTTRPNFMKDHNLKYLEFEALFPNRLAMLREIIESLPEGKRKATGHEIIEWVDTAFREVLKDHHALQEGSKCRNVLEDAVSTIQFKETEIKHLTEIIKLQNDNRRRSTN